MMPPKMCKGCGEIINGEAFCVEDGPPDPMRIGIIWFYHEASHYGAQFVDDEVELEKEENIGD